jgi:hypothetical protein
MKKIVILCLLLLCICVPVWANEADDARNIVTLTEQKDWVMNMNSLTNSFKKFEDQYPKTPILMEVMEIHITTNYLLLLEKYETKYGDIAWMKFYGDPKFKEEYPDCEYRIQKLYGWSNDNLAHILFEYWQERQNKLSQAVEKNYPKTE